MRKPSGDVRRFFAPRRKLANLTGGWRQSNYLGALHQPCPEAPTLYRLWLSIAYIDCCKEHLRLMQPEIRQCVRNDAFKVQNGFHKIRYATRLYRANGIASTCIRVEVCRAVTLADQGYRALQYAYMV